MENDTFTAEEQYKFNSIKQALTPILPNSNKEIIERIAQDELTQRIDKKNIINSMFQNAEFQTRNDPDLRLYSRKFIPGIGIRIGNLETINRIDRNYDSIITGSITPKDIEEIDAPTGIKIGNNRVEILPIEILGKKAWQVSILYGHRKSPHNDAYFYICLSEDKKIEIIANKDGYLSGNYDKLIDNYIPNEALHVELVPFTGKTTNIKGGRDVFTPDESRKVTIDNFLKTNKSPQEK